MGLTSYIVIIGGKPVGRDQGEAKNGGISLNKRDEKGDRENDENECSVEGERTNEGARIKSKKINEGKCSLSKECTRLAGTYREQSVDQKNHGVNASDRRRG